ncbi:MAG: response regulator [Campylobacterales bacterium]|nr:response regulator [Campylobacterales bacterium]
MLQTNEELLKNLSKGKKLLLVEDDPSVLEVLKNFLKGYFSLVKTASSGDEAWAMYRKEYFDLVVSDIEMPGTNGVLLSKGIKAKNPDQAILITSAYTDEKYLVELINIGVDGFLKKPINIENLMQTFVRLLRQVQVRNEAIRVKCKTITQEFTKKEIKIEKSYHQKKLEEVTIEHAKVAIKEYLEKIRKEDPESYEYFQTQKESLMDTLNELLDDYEVFAYKNYSDYESYEKILYSLTKLYTTLDTFDKVKQSTSQIYRLIQILNNHLNDGFDHSKIDAYDMLEFLLNDIRQFIFDMFIEQSVKDVTYFKESFKENITVFENALKGYEEPEDDEIEFL